MAEVKKKALAKATALHDITETRETELKDISDAAAEKGLYGQVGQSLLPFMLMGLSGGTLNPATYGFLTSVLSYGGRKGGEMLAGDMPTDLEYYQDEANEANKKVTGGALTDSIMAGLTAGATEKIMAMRKAGKAAELTNQAATTNKAILGGVKSGATDTLSINTGKIADVTGDKAVNILDIVASITPKDGGLKAKDLYKPQKVLSFGNKGDKAISDALAFIKSLKKD